MNLDGSTLSDEEETVSVSAMTVGMPAGVMSGGMSMTGTSSSNNFEELISGSDNAVSNAISIWKMITVHSVKYQKMPKLKV